MRYLILLLLLASCAVRVDDKEIVTIRTSPVIEHKAGECFVFLDLKPDEKLGIFRGRIYAKLLKIGNINHSGILSDGKIVSGEMSLNASAMSSDSPIKCPPYLENIP
jgi:hypothetical protein